jgi:hypothetical protein
MLLAAQAQTFTLNDGSSVTGEPVAWNEEGLVVKDAAGKYLPRVPWGRLTQDSLRELAKLPKIAPLVEPFIELTAEQKAERKSIPIKEFPRPARPPQNPSFNSVFGAPLGLVILLALYLANLYAAFEVSIFRARPVALVCGVSAVAPVIGPVVFLCLPTLLPKREEEVEPAAQPDGGPMVTAESPEVEAAPIAAAAGADGTGAPAAEPGTVAAPTVALPETVTFTRGQYTFNRRFFETRIPGFLTVVPKEADKDLVLVVKSARGDYLATRIAKLTQGEVHLLVKREAASMDVPVPYMEIKEVQIKHKDAP